MLRMVVVMSTMLHFGFNETHFCMDKLGKTSGKSGYIKTAMDSVRK